ncbi:hypothetical protein NA56DRAFT_692911 [Hyaloscypha hepaticicola]|uniref:F-box domain-containing protein n=1 Tax=Hyaloscypha hepaticicola TaxID=2082293 RepID=A0A2J6PQH3_9HELO|nr:hypothetical protein NA56DRAFT_692911 [Hyaloscypha hepaticicola]
MTFDSLPKEVLHNIISHGPPSYVDFRNYSLVCRNMNPHIGAIVRVCNTIHPLGYDYVQDDMIGTHEARPETLNKSAQNMRFLTKASLTANPLALEIVTNLPSYTQLTDLTIQKCQPKEYIWPRAYKTLKKKLHLNIWPRDDEDEPIPQTANFVIKVTESTCPDLESLDISFGAGGFPPSVASPNIDQYQGVQRSESSKLNQLRHFGLTYLRVDNSDQAKLNALTLSFAALYSQSLNSMSRPISFCSSTREALDFILEFCASLPHLKELSLIETNSGDEGQAISALEFLTELKSALASPNYEIERLSIDNIKVPYSPEVGELFASLKSLNLGPVIFGKLKKLHTCDIHAVITNEDGGLGPIPQKAIFYRRWPHLGADGNAKNIWTSRLDCIYQDFDHSVLKACQVVEGDFEGADASNQPKKAIIIIKS